MTGKGAKAAQTDRKKKRGEQAASKKEGSGSGSGSGSASRQRKHKKRTSSTDKRKLATSNWELLKATLPPPSGKSKKKKRLVGPEDAKKDAGAGAGAGAGAAAAAVAPVAPLFDAAAFVTAPFPREERGRGFYRGAEVTEYLGLDCEMVGSGSLSLLAEVCIVNFEGEVVYHRYVKPSMEVDDYRTHVSGVRAKDLKDGAPVNQVVKDVGGLLKDRIVVGHALENDFKALMLAHARVNVRDTALYPPFRRRNKLGRLKPKKLKHLLKEKAGVDIQTGEHNPTEDARAALLLYRQEYKEWEAFMTKRYGKGQGKKGKGKASV